MQTEIAKALNGSAPKTNNPAIACVMALAAQSYKTPDVVGLICDITPETARTLLSFRDERQRSVNKPRVQAYVRDMRANRWHSMGMPILLSTEGTLVDGQHRLHATVEAGFVWRGAKIEIGRRDLVQGVDVGTSRNAVDQTMFAMGRRVHGSVIAAIKADARDFATTWQTLSRSEEVQLVAACEHVEWLRTLQTHSRGQASAGFLGAALRCARADYEGANAFFLAVARRDPKIDGKYSPTVNVLINTLADLRGKSGSNYVRETAIRTLHAFNSWRAGRVVRISRYSPSMAVPEVE